MADYGMGKLAADRYTVARPDSGKRGRAAALFIFAMVFALTACHSVKRIPPVEQADFFTAHVSPMPMYGKVSVRFRPNAVKTRFATDPKGIGMERLSLNDEESRTLEDMDLLSVRRVKPQLEIRENGAVKVLSDAGLRAMLKDRPLAGEHAEALKGIERDMILRFPPEQHPQRLCDALKKLPSVEACEPQYSPGTLAPVMPNDPEFQNGNQWGFNNPAPGGPGQAPNFDIDAPEAWEVQQGSADVVVAVVDTGVDIRHRDIYEKIWINVNELPAGFVSRGNALSSDEWPDILTFTDLNAFSANTGTQTAMQALRNDYNLIDTNGNNYIDGEDLCRAFADGVDNDPVASQGEVDDIVGWNFWDNSAIPFIAGESHGTGVAGLVGATTDNGLDVAGAGWKVRIMAVVGEGSYPSIEYAVKHGARLITSSLAPYSDSAQLRATLSSLENKGIVFTTSLGNIDKYIDGTIYAKSPYAIAVSNFKSTGVRAAYEAETGSGGSSYSVNTDVAGPGSGTWSLNMSSGTRWFGGTSGANPVVAGIMSLMVSDRGDLKPEQFRQVLRESAVDIPPVAGDGGENTAGFDYYSGWGLANAKNALDIIHTDPWAEAKITTQYAATYASAKRGDRLHIIGDAAEVKVFAGVPGGGTSAISFDRAAGPPPLAGGWINVFSGNLPYVQDGFLTTLNRDDLSGGINTVRLTVTAGGRDFIDFGRIDVPHAYMDIPDHSMFVRDFGIRGFAFHPQFGKYELQVATGHGADEANDSLWTVIGTPLGTAKPPLPNGSDFTDQELFPSVPLSSMPDGEATLRLAVYDASNIRKAAFSAPVLIDKTVFPFQTGFPASPGWPFRLSGAAAYDLSGGGTRELVITNQASVIPYRHDGSVLPGWPADVGADIIQASAAIGDVTGDGLPEVVVRPRTLEYPSKESLYVYSRNGQPLSPWPIDMSTTAYVNRKTDHAPVLADMDGDGDLEILISGTPFDGVSEAKVLAFQGDGGLWHSYGPSGAKQVTLASAVGDLDGDGQLDIAMVTNHSSPPDGSEIYLSTWRADGTPLAATPVRIFPGTPYSYYYSSMVLAGLDGDDDLEIIIGAGNHLSAFHHDATPVTGLGSVELPDSSYRFMALSAGDLTPGDGSTAPQIVASYIKITDDAVDYYGLRAYKSDGTIVPGWENVIVEQDVPTMMQPNIFDVDNDGNMEVLIGPTNLSDDATFSRVFAFNHNGSPVADNRFPLYLSGEIPRAAAIADLDGDGDLEFGVAPHASKDVEAYDLDSLDDTGAVAWGMELHDPQRTGNYHGGVRILEPTQVRPGDVGSPTDASARNALLIRLRHELPHGSLDQIGLTIKINGAVAPVSAFAKVEGEHWVVVMPPDQAAAGDFVLEVTWNDGGIRRIARQKAAVRYTATSTPTDQVLVMDRSGSMLDYDKYLASRTAANFYISARSAQDKAGVVSFHSQAADEVPEMLLLGPEGSAERSRMAGVINSVTPPGPWATTSIGAGLKKALEEVMPSKQAGRSRAMVLLSDGLENTAPFWDRGASPVRNLFELPENDDIVIHTIALGPDADRDLHSAIAESTGGTARFVYLGNSFSLYGRLADAYKQVEEIIGREQRIFTSGEDFALQETKTYTVSIPAGATQASFAISYRDPQAAVRISVVSPDGTVLDARNARLLTGPSSEVVRLNSPAAGTYRITVTAFKAATEVLTAVSLSTPKQLVASIAWPAPSGVNSMRGTLLAGLVVDGGFYRNTAPSLVRLGDSLVIKARVTAPDKKVFETLLYDDGGHRDGGPGDGIYAAPVDFTIGGGYGVTVIAVYGNERQQERIEKTIGFYQPRALDSDLDGIPDAWERERFPKTAVEKLNPLFDHDRDGLNLREEYLYKTDPRNYDTDHDGRPDGTEVDAGTDPLKADPRRSAAGDRDGDGVPDAWERLHFGKDAALVDVSASPDGDGLQTYTEWKLGTDPNRADSDGDGIADDVQSSWRTPGPATRVWHPQPRLKPEKEWPSCKNGCFRCCFWPRSGEPGIE